MSLGQLKTTNYVGITGEPDIKIEYEGNVRYLELMDALSPVEQYGQFDMRLSKAENQFNRKNLFLLHSLGDGKYVLIDFMRDNVTVTYNYPNPRFGNKPCSVVRLKENGIRMYGMSLFWESLKDIMLNTKPEPAHHYLKLVDYKTGSVKMFGSDGTDEGENTEEDESSSRGQTDDNLETESDTDTRVIQSLAQVDAPPPSTTETSESEEEPITEDEPPVTEIEDDSSIIAEDENGQTIAYTEEQWAALNEVF